jgi:hypothetical protein
MKFNLAALAAIAIAPLALAAPAATADQVKDASKVSSTEQASIGALWRIEDNNVVVGPGGYIDATGFHEGEYVPQTETAAEKRGFFIILSILRKLGGGWRYHGGGFHGPHGEEWNYGGCNSCSGGY